MIDSILQIANTGMVATSRAVEIQANNIVNAATPDYTAQAAVFSPVVGGGVAVFAQETGGSPDPLAGMMAMIIASNQYKAAASLVPTGLNLSATLLQTVCKRRSNNPSLKRPDNLVAPE